MNETGVDPQFCANRRQLLSAIGDELHIWGRTFRQRYGVVTTPVFGGEAEDGELDEDVELDDDSEVVEVAEGDEATA